MKKTVILNIVLIALASFCFANEAKQQKPMTVRSGDSFTITLRANMSTGYQWKMATLDETMLQLVNSEYIPYKTRRLGADGKQMWTFKALKAGETSINFEYVRPHEKDKPPERQQIIPILIK